VFFAMAAFLGLTVYVPLFFELVLGLSAAQSGMVLVGYMMGNVIGAMVAGRMTARVANYKRMPLIGLALASAGLAWLAYRSGTLGLVECELVLILVGLGTGQQFPVTTVAIQNAVDPRDLGVATGLLSFMRAMGSAIGVAIVGAVGAMSGITVNAIVGHGGASAPTGSALLDGRAFAPVFLAASICLALSCVALWLMPLRTLRAK
jgi:MFS family permease